MKTKLLLAMALSIFLTGCANNPPVATAAQLAGADYGKYPENYQQIVKDYYNKVLFDPYSAQFRFPEKPYKGYTRKAPVLGGAPEIFGYVATACVNGKNKFGGYVGEKCERFLIRNGVLVGQFGNMQPFFQEPWYQ